MDAREFCTSPRTTFMTSVLKLSLSLIARASSIGTKFPSLSSSARRCVFTRSLLKITSSRSTFCRKKTLLNTSPAKKNNGPTTGQRNIMIPFIRISVFFSFCLILLFPITYKTATAVLIRRTIQNLFSATVIQIHPPVSGRTHPLFQIFLLPWLHLLHWYLQEAHTFFHLQVHRHNRFV